MSSSDSSAVMLGGGRWSRESSRSSSTLPSAPPSTVGSEPPSPFPLPPLSPLRRRLECSVCDRTFTRHFVFAVHMRRHTRLRPYQCLLCGRAFASNFNVKRHLNSHKVWPHQAAGPVQAGQLQPPVVPHLEGSGSDQPASTSATPVGSDITETCPYCRLDVEGGKQAVEAHIVGSHPDQKKYQCPVCSCRKFFAALAVLLSHLEEIPDPTSGRRHGMDRRFTCPFCSLTFDSLRDSRLHQHAHALMKLPASTSGEFSVSAEQNSAVGGSEQSPSSVFKKPARPRKATIPCNSCSSMFRSYEALERHVSQAHLGGGASLCRSCGKRLASPRLLRRHAARHADARLPCTHCHRRFPSTATLANHRRVHADAQAHVCTICSMEFRRAADLRRHQGSVHTDRPSFACPVPACKKAFKRLDLLKAHSHQHKAKLDGKRVVCKMETCGKSFSSAKTLRVHESSAHGSSPMFACPQCQRPFRRKDVLGKHIKICKTI